MSFSNVAYLVWTSTERSITWQASVSSFHSSWMLNDGANIHQGRGWGGCGRGVILQGDFETGFNYLYWNQSVLWSCWYNYLMLRSGFNDTRKLGIRGPYSSKLYMLINLRLNCMNEDHTLYIYVCASYHSYSWLFHCMHDRCDVGCVGLKCAKTLKCLWSFRWHSVIIIYSRPLWRVSSWIYSRFLSVVIVALKIIRIPPYRNKPDSTWLFFY